MFFRLAIPLALLLSVYPDLPHLLPSAPANQPRPDAFSPEDRIPLYPPTLAGGGQEQDKPPQAGSKKSATLQETSKLSLIRYVPGEFEKARKPLPGGKEGFILYADKPVDDQALNR